ncbi:MAG: hypothetical protein ACYCZ0_05095 [Minisyncoccota bacterium]
MNRRFLFAGLLALPFAGKVPVPMVTDAVASDTAFYKAVFSEYFAATKSETLAGPELWIALSRAAYAALDKIADRALGLAADGVFDIVFEASINGR